jgi:predicted esterase
MESKHIQVQKTARYFTLGSLTPTTKHIWFVCHGYGQLANYFLKKFEIIEDEQTFIIAPEALNRFYLQGFTGRIGATWMTREERLSEIEDYVQYLNQLYSAVLSDINKSNIMINILGFSQGVATVCRWLASRQVKADNLILWAGQLPADMDIGLTRETLSQTTMYVIYGTKDEFLKDINPHEYIGTFTIAGFAPHIISFRGTHEIHQQTLIKLRDRIVSKEGKLQ